MVASSEREKSFRLLDTQSRADRIPNPWWEAGDVPAADRGFLFFDNLVAIPSQFIELISQHKIVTGADIGFTHGADGGLEM